MKKTFIDKPMPLISHLTELRRRIIFSLILILVCAMAVYNNVPKILTHLTNLGGIGKLVFLGPVEAFWVRIKIAFFLGLYIASPFVFYQTWRFIEVGLKRNERRYILPLTITSFFLFTLGAGFCYFLVVPIGMKFLLGYATPTLVPMLSVSKYISFLLAMLFAFGIIFELPLIVGFLAKIGLVSPKTLREKRKIAVVGIFIVAAALTPGPDVFSQLLMAIPLLVLYELSIIVAKLVKKQEVI